MPFQLQEVAADVVYVDERKFFVNVVLCDVDVKVIHAVLVKSRVFCPGSDIACHSVRNKSACNRHVLANDSGQSRVLAVGNVVEHGEIHRAVKHPEYSINFSGEDGYL